MIGLIATSLVSYGMEVNATNNISKVVGTFESTILDVQIPAISTFIYNPNTEKLVTNSINISSFTNAPIYMSLNEINITDESKWKPKLISPNSYSIEGWRNLTEKESEENIAIGLTVFDQGDWLKGIQNQSVWSTETNDKNKVGVIKNHGNVSGEPILTSGNSIPANQILNLNYVFEFGLEVGEAVNKSNPLKLNYAEIIANSSTEELFANLPNANTPVIIGNELYATNYFNPNQIYVYDTLAKELKRTLNYTSKQKVGSGGRFYSLGSDGENLLAFSTSNIIEIINKNTGEIIGTKQLDTTIIDTSTGLIGSPTFVVKDGYLYATSYYGKSMYIFDYESGNLIKKINDFVTTSGIAIIDDNLVVLERNMKILHVYDIEDRLNPKKENTIKITNNYDNIGVAMDEDYIYIATYNSHTIIRYPISKFK